MTVTANDTASDPADDTADEPAPPATGRAASWLDRVVHLLLPAPCLGCGTPLPARPSPLGLCPSCRRELPAIPIDSPACRRCGRPLAAAELPPGWRCGECRRRPPAFDRLLAVWHYAPPIDGVIRGLKFHRLEYLGRHLGRRMAARIRDEVERDPRLAARFPHGTAVVPVPLHGWRRLRRGYNQAEAIARPLAAELGLALRRDLRRRRATPRQTRLPRRERRRNPVGAFRCRRRPPEDTVVLVDDVTTTGATLDAAAACLKAAGVSEVVAVAAARTPAHML